VHGGRDVKSSKEDLNTRFVDYVRATMPQGMRFVLWFIRPRLILKVLNISAAKRVVLK